MRRLLLALASVAVATTLSANDLTGSVVDAAAKPVTGAQVYVYAAHPRVGLSELCPTCYRDCGKHQLVDANGAFRLADLNNTLIFDVLAVADGYQSALVQRVNPDAGPLKIELTRRTAEEEERLVRGTVLAPDGKPIAGAVVMPRGYHMTNGLIAWGIYPGVEKVAVTNPKGEFSLRLPERTGKLDARIEGRGVTRHLERAMAPGEPRTIHMTDGVTVTGHLTNEGKPVAGAHIVLSQRNRASSDYLGRDEIATNKDGLFVITNVPPNVTWYVYATMDSIDHGYVEPKLITTGADGSSLDAGTLTVQRGRHIAGSVVLPADRPLPPDARVLLVDFASDDRRSVPIDAAGGFSFDDAPRSELLLSTDGPMLHMRTPTKVEAGNDCIDVRLVVPKQ